MQIMNQYPVSEGKRSSIVNLADGVVQVSMKTAKIVRGLAALPFAERAVGA